MYVYNVDFDHFSRPNCKTILLKFIDVQIIEQYLYIRYQIKN